MICLTDFSNQSNFCNKCYFLYKHIDTNQNTKNILYLNKITVFQSEPINIEELIVLEFVMSARQVQCRITRIKPLTSTVRQIMLNVESLGILGLYLIDLKLSDCFVFFSFNFSRSKR